jgi:hypothetical protein
VEKRRGKTKCTGFEKIGAKAVKGNFFQKS